MSAEAPVAPPWSFASLDLNVFLSGELVEGNSGEGVEGAQFRLGRLGIWIDHPSLISITSTPITHTLYSVNLAKPILSLPISPSASPSPARAREEGDEGTTDLTEGTIVTLHAPLLTPQEYENAKQSPYYSANFDLVLDSDEAGIFLPPELDLAHLTAPPSPKHNPVSISPSIQRALLSPLLSPQRRAASAGSDLSVPPLSLGLSRQPPTRLQPPSGLPALLPAFNSNKSTLQQTLSSRLSAKSKEMTDELIALRNKQEAFTKRIRAEFDLLEARANNFGVGVAANGGRTRIVKGFNVSGSTEPTSANKEPPVSGSARGKSVEGRRETSLEREASNSIASPERRGRRPSITTRKDGSQEFITDDELLSQKIQEADRKEEESRGRSRSRARRSSKKQAEENEAEETRPGTEIRATKEDEIESDGKAVPELIPEKKGKEGVDGGEEGEDEENNFVPSSHHLVTISEVEEETASKTPQGSVIQSKEVESNGKKEDKEQQVDLEEEEHEEEDEHPFDMDEDIESSLVEEDATPAEEEAAPPPAAGSSLAPPSASYRPGSYRPSSMAASMAALLSSSKSPKPPAVPASAAYFTPPPSNIFSNSSPSARTNAEVRRIARADMTPEPDVEDYSLHPTQPDPAEEGRDALKNFINSPAPDVQAAKEGVRQIRDVLAMDAPSHRAPLPVRRRGGRKRDDNESEDDEDPMPSVPTKQKDTINDKFRVGSLPVTSRNSSKYASSFRPEPERELERKTSVPSRREGMFVHPLPRLTSKKIASSSSTTSPPSTISISKSPVPPTSIISGPSSLAQSLKNPPSSMSFSVLADKEQEMVVEAGEEQEVDEESFVPPHVWANKNQPLVKMLGRSVHDFH